MQKAHIIICHRFFLYFILSSFLTGSPPSIEKIKTNLLTNYEKIEDYSVKIKLKLKMPGLRMPRKKLKLYFKAPDKIKVETRGFALVPKSGLGGSPLKYLNKLSSIELLGKIEYDGRVHWHLGGPILPDSLEFDLDEFEELPDLNMQFWVDPESWTLSKLETRMDTIPILTIQSDHTDIDGIFLPEKTVVEMSLESLKNWHFRNPTGGPAGDNRDFHDMIQELESEEFSGRMTIEFSKYKVNQGIDDSIFEDKNEVK